MVGDNFPPPVVSLHAYNVAVLQANHEIAKAKQIVREWQEENRRLRRRCRKLKARIAELESKNSGEASPSSR